MNIQEQRDVAIAKVNQTIEQSGVALRHSHKAIHRFLEFLRIQMPSVAERYIDQPAKIEAAIASNFSNIPDDADASIQPVRGDQPFSSRKIRKRRK